MAPFRLHKGQGTISSHRKGEGIGSNMNESRNACMIIIIDDLALWHFKACVQRHDIPKRNGRHDIGTMQNIQTRKQVNTPLIIEEAPNE